ncbi:hypothetical protein C5S31_01510 [ANME-1 cluster archaeon GoMg2]|nr:hypothetical protein [ANME-1 cluster archaeon GoMg2]
MEICSDNVIEIVERKSCIDYNRCTCCGVCDRVCRLWCAGSKKSVDAADIKGLCSINGFKSRGEDIEAEIERDEKRGKIVEDA